MKKTLSILCTVSFTAVAIQIITKTYAQQNSPAATKSIDAVSRSSFGNPKSRVQIHKNASKMKLSYNVKGYDDISGPTYILDHVADNGQIVFTNSKSTALVDVIDSNTVQVTLDPKTILKFSPKGTDLGIDPKKARPQRK